MSRTRKDRHIYGERSRTIEWGWEHWSVPAWFKRANRREERSKQNKALRQGEELPIYRTRDKYEYW